jgi:hypothetical protein
MITGKLSNGFKFKVDEEALESAEFRDLIAGTISVNTQEKIRANANLLSFLIGDEAKAELYAKIKEETGKKYTPVTEVDKYTIEIMGIIEEKNKNVKNSESSPE